MTRYIHSPSLKVRLWLACSLDGGLVAALYKMAAMQEQSFCVLEYAKCSSVTSVQRAFLHWSTIARDFLNRELPHRWTGRTGLYNVPLLSCLPRSPDLSPCDFFLRSCNAASTAGTHHCCCDGRRRKHATERLEGIGLPLGCVPGTKGSHIKHL
ncbi:hypothetical protein AVEN_75616-1 [Araneus ventricosus]|uniref:Uncharacterized protein n=1 Tax=Araneus ventricosus TaxID=182803 RepID=A0A4Y2CLR1_ARAVE|nr:hypothetical protein AVEN_75616-1 [Araneus ventricosus]